MELTDAEDDEEDDVDDQLAERRLDRQLLVTVGVVHVLCRPDSCMQHTHSNKHYVRAVRQSCAAIMPTYDQRQPGVYLDFLTRGGHGRSFRGRGG